MNTTGNSNKPAVQAITPRLLTVPQSAIYCGVSPSRIWQYIHYRKLHKVDLPHPWKQSKDARKTLLDVRELDSFIDQYSEHHENESILKVKAK